MDPPRDAAARLAATSHRLSGRHRAVRGPRGGADPDGHRPARLGRSTGHRLHDDDPAVRTARPARHPRGARRTGRVGPAGRRGPADDPRCDRRLRHRARGRVVPRCAAQRTVPRTSARAPDPRLGLRGRPAALRPERPSRHGPAPTDRRAEPGWRPCPGRERRLTPATTRRGRPASPPRRTMRCGSRRPSPRPMPPPRSRAASMPRLGPGHAVPPAGRRICSSCATHSRRALSPRSPPRGDPGCWPRTMARPACVAGQAFLRAIRSRRSATSPQRSMASSSRP